MPIAIGTYTITEIFDGQNGKDSIIAVLSNESHTVPADKDGNVSSFSGAATTVYIYKGATDDSANWTVTAGTPVGIGGTLSGKTYTVNAMSADTGYVDLTATPVGGGSSVTKRFTLSKSKQGTAGANGSNGTDAYIYRITPSVYAIKNVGGAFTPGSITFSATRAQGTGNPTAYAGRFIIAESTDGTNFTTKYTSTVEESSKAYTPSGSTVTFVRATLYLAGGTTVKLDEQTTPVVSDGATGPQGPTGSQGAPGIQGPPGPQGQATYTWIRYADDINGNGISSSPTGKSYMGIAYNKTSSSATNTPSDYAWSLILGPQGPTGATGSQGIPGPAGSNGQPTYTWIKYADNASGGGMSDSPTGKTYMGIAYNKLTQTESSVATDYEWSLIQGPQGPQGNPGAPGASAKYIQITGEQVFRYTNNFTGGPAPATITLTATKFGTTATGDWQWYNGTAWVSWSPVTSATTLSVSPTSGNLSTQNRIQIRYLCDGVWDEFTVIRVSDGATGANGTNGTNGAAGADAYTVILSNESNTFAGGVASALAGSTVVGVIAYKGGTPIGATIGTPTGLPTGMTAGAPTNNGTTSASITFTVTTSMVTRNGKVTIPITVDGKSFTKEFSYSIALTGANGTDGKGVSSVTEEYYLSTSSSSQVGGSWTTTVPTWTTNTFLWRRQRIVYTSGPDTYTSPYYDASWTTQSSTVNTLSTAVNVSNGKITGAIDSASITTTNGTTNMQSFANSIVADTTGLKVSVSEMKTKLNNNLVINAGHFSELGGWETSSDATIVVDSFDFTDVSHFFVKEPSISVPAGGNIIGSDMNKDIPIEGNKTYIFSAWIKFGNTFATTSYQPLGFYLNTAKGGTSTTNGGGLAVLTEDRTIVSGSWKRYYVRFKTPSAQTIYYITPLVDGKTGTTASYLIGNMMLEKVDDTQTAPSPWVESIAETSYASSQLAIQKDMILSKVEKDGIISAIELLPASATISAERINFNGTVTVGEYLGKMDGLIAEEDRANVATTVIKGDRIQTGSITARQLDTSNFSIIDANKNTTFRINSAGDVLISGEIKSAGFDENPSVGYYLEKNGNATINNATINGSLMLSDSGISSYGSGSGKNMLVNSNFGQVYNGTATSKNPGRYPTSWGGYNAGVTNATTVFHAHSDETTFKFPVVEFNETDGTKHWKGISQSGLQSKILPIVEGSTTKIKDYVFSVDIYTTAPSGGTKIFGGFYYTKVGGTTASFHAGQFLFTSVPEPNKWFRMTGVAPLGQDVDLTKTVSFYIYGYGFPTNDVTYIKDAKLEEGKSATLWSPSPDDGLRYTRFWAGSTYAERHNAPFRVMEDGSVIATKGTFGGTITGSLSIGNVHIQDTNESNGFIRFMDNNNINTLIDLNETESYFNTNFTLGTLTDKKLFFDKTNNRVTISTDTYMNSQLFVKDEITISKGNTSVETIVDTTGKYKIVHNGQKTNITDPHILIQSGVGRVDVEIDGSLQVDDEIRMSGTVRMVSRANGIDFVVS